MTKIPTIFKWAAIALMILAGGTAILCFMTDNIVLMIVNIILFGINLWVYFMNKEMEGWGP